jgi:hypothetical protein
MTIARALHFPLYLCVASCFLSPLPDLRTPADRARQVAPKCTQDAAGGASDALLPSGIESVQPSYAYVASSSTMREARLRGARLFLRPAPGLSRESLQRSLECHQSRVVLGGERELPDDPYVLPGAWLDIGAASTGDGFVVDVQADTFQDAQRVLDRARRFVARPR